MYLNKSKKIIIIKSNFTFIIYKKSSKYIKKNAIIKWKVIAEKNCYRYYQIRKWNLIS